MAKPRRTRASARYPYRPEGLGDDSGDRIPYADKVDRDDPARSDILITIHRMQLAGVEIDDRAIEIATKLGRWHAEQALLHDPMEEGDVPHWKRHPNEIGGRRPAWVYYVRRGNLVKIGTTVDLPTRMIALRPNEILALEPGGEQLERKRHREFASCRVDGEYFHPGRPLQEHILRLRQEHGVPEPSVSILPDGQDYFCSDPLDR